MTFPPVGLPSMTAAAPVCMCAVWRSPGSAGVDNLPLAGIVTGHRDGGVEAFVLVELGRQGLPVRRLVDGGERRRERRGRFDHLLVVVQPDAVVERDGRGHAAAVPV